MGEPARNYSWPPWEPGNTAALTHGADSPRQVQPLADELATQLVEAAPWVGHPAFADELADWAWEAARVRLLRRWIDERSLLDEDVEGAVNQYDRARASAARLRQNLGLSPIAWAKVLATLASAKSEAAAGELEALAAVGRELQARAAGELKEAER